uniref:Metallophosphoesterase domain containing 1 n=1 Tax=Sus scrofa TaxID=9823 RepID=A0A8D1F7T3_PIG
MLSILFFFFAFFKMPFDSSKCTFVKPYLAGQRFLLQLPQPWFYGWGFNLPRGQALLEKWNLIPEGVDILITHGPPLGFLDWVPKKMQRVGCVELLNTVQRRVQPRLHVFGHIHEGYGVMADGTTTYVNASVCTVNYQPVNPPIVIDLPTPRNS